MERIAERVWLVRGGMPRVMNVYLIEDQDGMTMFDGGISQMPKMLIKAAAPHGGIKRIVLGHSHTDHRGTAPKIAATTGAPIYCHADEVADAEGDGGMHYFRINKLPLRPGRFAMPLLLRMWDGGPVKIEDTVGEGDEVAGFQVISLPGHAPGLIGLYRESDGLVLGSDAIYTLDPLTSIKGPPRIPLDGFNNDTELAKTSALKLATIAPKTIWTGHGDGLAEDVPDILGELGRKGGVLGA